MLYLFDCINKFFDFKTFLPFSCLFCHALLYSHQKFICDMCEKVLPSLPHHCQQCAKFLPVSHPQCGRCLKSAPPFTKILTLFPYEFPIAEIIVQLKFQQKLIYADFLASLLYKQITEHWYQEKNLPDLLIPIPLHVKRLRERGFNQAVEIAKPIAKKLHIPLDLQGVKRIKNTLAQSGLKASKRKANVANAFYTEKDYSGLSIALIDDVVTTGYTVIECCNLLKRQGAKEIVVWCCARKG